MTDKEFDEQEEVGIPQKNRITRRYTLSDKALEQRRAAAKRPKGPGVARNAWKHGRFAKNFIQHKIKPCRSSCSRYPCELVEDNATAPGGDCLDKAEVLETYRTIVSALRGDPQEFHDRLGLIAAEALQVLANVLEDIQRDGTVVKEDLVNKDGDVIGKRYKQHPGLAILPKLLNELGAKPADLMLTPKELSRKQSEEEGANVLADLLSAIGKNAQTNDNHTPDYDD